MAIIIMASFHCDRCLTLGHLSIVLMCVHVNSCEYPLARWAQWQQKKKKKTEKAIFIQSMWLDRQYFIGRSCVRTCNFHIRSPDFPFTNQFLVEAKQTDFSSWTKLDQSNFLFSSKNTISIPMQPYSFIYGWPRIQQIVTELCKQFTDVCRFKWAVDHHQSLWLLATFHHNHPNTTLTERQTVVKTR